MKKNLFKATTLALTAFVVSACNLVGNLGTLAMDSEDAVKKVKNLVTDNIDTGEWKIIGISWNEGGGNGQLANDLNSGFVSVNMVKKDDGREEFYRPAPLQAHGPRPEHAPRHAAGI